MRVCEEKDWIQQTNLQQVFFFAQMFLNLFVEMFQALLHLATSNIRVHCFDTVSVDQ